MKYFITALLSAVIGWLLSIQFTGSPDKLIVRDTVKIQSPPVVVEKIKPKLVYKRDTIVKTKPFKAVVDTVIMRDTVKLRYDFPENEMKLAVRMAADSVVNHYPQLRNCPQKQEWWEDPAIATGGVILGILLTKTIE